MKKTITWLIAVILALNIATHSSLAASDHTYYSQYGWNNNSSLCYCTCVAMVLTDAGITTTPLDIYKFNGNTAYCKDFQSIASNFGATYYNVDLRKLSAENKEAKIIQLVNQHSQGVIVYGGGHMIVARQVLDGTVCFDDPAHKDGWQTGGCCVPISKCNKVTWNNITYAGYFEANGDNKGTSSIPFFTTLNFVNLTTPGNLSVGSGGHIDGSITSSNSPICSVKAEVCNAAGKVYLTATSNGFSVSTYGPLKNSKIDKELAFGKLPAGTYYIKYTATTMDGTSDTSSTTTFNVGSLQHTEHEKGKIAYCGNDHPHYNYYECSICGEVFTDGSTNYVESCKSCNQGISTTHTHSKGLLQYSESQHPHYNYYECSTCGEVFTDGSTTTNKSCNQCCSPWSDWSRTPVTPTSTREVETRQVRVPDGHTEYRYGRYVDSTGKHDCWCAKYLEGLSYVSGSAILQYSSWSTTRYSANSKGWSCGYCSGSHTGVDHYGADGRAWWAEYVLPNGSYYWEETQWVDTSYSVTEYRYRDLLF